MARLSPAARCTSPKPAAPPLCFAAAPPHCCCAISLPPCRCAVWQLVNGGGPKSASGPPNGLAFCAIRSFFRSKFQTLKTPLSHGLTGLAAIKPVAKSARFSGREQRLVCSGGRGFPSGAPLAVCRCAALFIGLFKAAGQKAPAAHQAALFWRDALIFQERISGPENAPIARFDGLGCYQSRSGEKAESGMAESGNAAVHQAARGFRRRVCAGARRGCAFLRGIWQPCGGRSRCLAL